MKINNNPYCLLKYACSLGISEYSLLSKPRVKCTFEDDYAEEFYSESYDDFESLIARINCIYDGIVQGCVTHNIDIYGNQCSFPIFFVCNSYGNYLLVGISVYGWRISTLFFGYLQEYLENKYGKEDGEEKYLQLALKNDVFFYWDADSEPMIDSSEEQVSKETAHIILKEFLDTGKTEHELDPEIFRREILKRNY